MTKELDIYGVYVSPLAVWGVLSYLVVKALHAFLAKKNFYRSDVEQELFDVSLFVVFLSIFSFIF